jgi:NADH dehydrogenase
MILVAGGTGTLGRRVVERLLAQGRPVRVFCRHPEAAPPEWGDRVERVAGDVRSRDAVTAAMSGVDHVLSLAHGFFNPERDAQRTTDGSGNANLVEAAAAAGAAMVLMSIVRADQQSGVELFRVKHEAEQHLRRRGVRAVIVRATLYMDTWLDVMEQTASRTGRPLVPGHGRNPVNFVAADDVAALVVRAATDPALRGRTLQIGGPDNLTLNQFAAAAQRAAGRFEPPRRISRPALRAIAALVGGVEPMLARQARLALLMDTTDMTFDSAPLHATVPGLPVTTVAQVLAARAATPAVSVADAGALRNPRDHVTDDPFSLGLVEDLVPEARVHPKSLIR